VNFREMFPSKYLSCQDIPAGEMTIVTIASVRPVQAIARPGNQGGGAELQEPIWALHFHELRKPLKLKAYKCEAIASALGTPNTELWVGRRIKIFPGSVPVGGESKPVVLVDPSPMPASDLQLPGRTAPPGEKDQRPIGIKNADAFRAAMAEQGAAFEDCLAWLRRQSQDAYEAAHGRELSELPRWLAPLLQRFLREYQDAAKARRPIHVDRLPRRRVAGRRRPRRGHPVLGAAPMLTARRAVARNRKLWSVRIKIDLKARATAELKADMARVPGTALRVLGDKLTTDERAECIARVPGTALRVLGDKLTTDERKYVDART
jgi:hypothetical protein